MPIDIEEGLAPGFLIAAPDLKDAHFSKAVILLVESEDEGAMGFIVNKSLPVRLGDLKASLEIDVHSDVSERTLVWGGPVKQERGWLLAFHRDVAEFLNGDPVFSLDDGLYVITELHTLQRFLTSAGDRDFLLVLGYAGWGAEQLSDEMKEGSWLPLQYDSDLLMNYSGEAMWLEAMKRIGINPAFYFSGGGMPSA